MAKRLIWIELAQAQKKEIFDKFIQSTKVVEIRVVREQNTDFDGFSG